MRAPLAFLGALLAVTTAGVQAADVRVFVAGAAKAAIERIAPEFERATGDRVLATFDTVGALRERIVAGERPDLTILSGTAVDALATRGLVAADGRREIGVVDSGLAVRRGAPVPDIADEAALKRTLLAARSIAHADGARGATSGAHFASVIDKLGLRGQLQERITVLPFGVDVIEGVAQGNFEIGVSQSSEIVPHPGVTFVGGLPAPHALVTSYVAATIGDSNRGAELLRFIDQPASRAQFEAAGFARR
jgi:molybdate transport system substrate-binding protein